MKIKAFRVTENGLGEKKQVPIAIHYRPDTGEGVATEAVDIVSVNWDRYKGTMLVKYALGGYDNDGLFVPNTSWPIENYQFSRQFTQKVWDKYGFEDLPTEEQILEALTEEPAISASLYGKWAAAGIEIEKVKSDGNKDIGIGRISPARKPIGK